MEVKRQAYRILSVACILVVSGCAATIPRHAADGVAPSSAPADLLPAVPLAQRTEPLAVSATPESPPRVIPLSLDTALLTAITLNRSIEVARFGPPIGATLIPEARAAFDPALSASLTTGRDKRFTETSTTATSSLSTSLLGTNNATTQSDLENIISALRKLDQLVAAVETPGVTSVVTESTQGSIGIAHVLPTGTALSLSGTGSATDYSLADDDNQGAWSLDVTQPLLEGAGTRVNLIGIRQARNQAEQAHYLFREQVLGVMQQVEIEYWNLVLARAILEIRQFAVTIAEEQLRRNQDLLDVGRAIEADVLAAQAELATRTADLIAAQASLKSHNVTLIRLLNPTATAQWTLSFDPTEQPQSAPVAVDPEQSAQRALAYRPEIGQTQLEVANRDLDTVRTKNQLLPRLDVVGAYGRNSSGRTSAGMTRYLDDADAENYRIGVEFQMPILNRAEKARHKRALLTLEQSEASLAELRQAIDAEVRQGVIGVGEQWERLQATARAVASRTEQLRVEQGRYEVGRLTNLDLLQVQRDLIQAQLDEATARIAYAQSLTNLYAAEGTLLARRGISLEGQGSAN